MLNDVGDIENGTIVWQYVCIGGKEEVAPCATADVRFAEVASVTVRGANHVACMVSEHGFFLRGKVVKEL